MANVGNRVKETTSTTGTGTLDLEGAPTGFRSFSDEFSSGEEVYYLIVDDPSNPTAYEYGVGTFTAATPDTLSRDTVEGSSNSGNKVSLTGTNTVIATPTAKYLNSLFGVGADIASASSLNIGDRSVIFDVTGTTTITAITARLVGTRIILQFDGALTLTHHSTDLVLPGGANITTAAGDIAEFVEYATGDWRCITYQRANVRPNRICQMATGTYTGDGSTSLAITGVGFRPKFLLIWDVAADGGTINNVLMTSDTYMALDAQGLAAFIIGGTSNFNVNDNRVLSLDADGFTVSDDGVDGDPNASGNTYHYVAFG